MNRVLLLILFCLIAGIAQAEIFGDGDAGNGVEDNRIALAASEVAIYQRFVGAIECDKRIRGTGILLRVSGALSASDRPILLTARHVLADVGGQVRQQCSYLPATNIWQALPLGQSTIGLRVDDQSGATGDISVLTEFSEDWAVALVETSVEEAPLWRAQALPFELSGLELIAELTMETTIADEIRTEQQQDRKETGQAFLIGYDSGRGRFMIDKDCQFGDLNQGSVFGGVEALVWDNCDSVRGSSGGALFSLTSEKPTLIGVRVGNAFDVAQHPSGPAPGDRFDVNANINLSRLVGPEIAQAIRRLLEESGPL